MSVYFSLFPWLSIYLTSLSFQEYILETRDTERKATRLMEHRGRSSGTDLAATFSQGATPLVKNSSSKTLIKSPSKFSQKSGISIWSRSLDWMDSIKCEEYLGYSDNFINPGVFCFCNNCFVEYIHNTIILSSLFYKQ